MNHISTLQFALSYVGVFLGAGFVSGQELWQFFACFGPVGLLGFLGTAALFVVVDYSALRLVMATGQEDMSWLMTPGDRPLLRKLVAAMQGLLLYGVTVIMIAGAAVLIAPFTGLPQGICGLAFTLVVALVALMGMSGLVATFSLVVPVTTLCALILGGVTLVQCGFAFPEAVGGVSALVPNWVVGLFTYAVYNLFGTICVLVPMAKLLPDLATLKRGLGVGSVLLILLAGSIIAALAARPDAGLEELPMGMLAGDIHPLLEGGYGLLMGLGMFSAALSSAVALVAQMVAIRPTVKAGTREITAGVLILAWLLSLLGFGNLIGIIYPIFGYAGIPFLICVVYNWKKESKKMTPPKEEAV